MSIAEFNTGGFDPSDPSEGRFEYDEYEAIPSGQTEKSISWPLNESELDYMSKTGGWEKIQRLPSQPPMASYRKDDIRLNFWLWTGSVGSYLCHPSQGKTQLFRRDISMSEASDIFKSPRQHTGKGYHTKNENKSPKKKMINHKHSVYYKKCAKCGNIKHRDNFSNTQRMLGSASKCKKCVSRPY